MPEHLEYVKDEAKVIKCFSDEYHFQHSSNHYYNTDEKLLPDIQPKCAIVSNICIIQSSKERLAAISLVFVIVNVYYYYFQ